MIKLEPKKTKSTLSKGGINAIERGRSMHPYEKSKKSLALGEKSPTPQKKSRGMFLNPSLQLKLLSKSIIIFLCIGFIYVVFNRNFDPYTFFINLTSQNFAPFDYNEFLSKVNSSLDNLPSMFSGLRGISQIIVSIGYSFFWVIGVLNFLITG